jgi:hypothetical protein
LLAVAALWLINRPQIAADIRTGPVLQGELHFSSASNTEIDSEERARLRNQEIGFIGRTRSGASILGSDCEVIRTSRTDSGVNRVPC